MEDNLGCINGFHTGTRQTVGGRARDTLGAEDEAKDGQREHKQTQTCSTSGLWLA